ncbi:hypothetical protein WN943_018920 [Citrus x changshan-huyou]
MALREKVMKIVVPSLLWEVTSNKSRSNTRGDRRARMEDCLNSVIRITILCSMESPNKLIDVKAIIYKVEHKADKQNSTSFLENSDLEHHVVLICFLIFFSSLWRVYVDLGSPDVEELLLITLRSALRIVDQEG